jgi:predicted transcriptional regulator
MNPYERLREILDAHPATAPKAESIDQILRILFTPQEADIAIYMSFKPKKVASIAKLVNLDENTVKTRLESMANKGNIYSRRKDGDVS